MVRSAAGVPAQVKPIRKVEIDWASLVARPYRRTLGDVRELAHAIADQSIIGPVVAVDPGKGFVPIFGERRIAALRMLGMPLTAYLVRSWAELRTWMDLDYNSPGRTRLSPLEVCVAADTAQALLGALHNQATDSAIAAYQRMPVDELRFGRYLLVQSAKEEWPTHIKAKLAAELPAVQEGSLRAATLYKRLARQAKDSFGVPMTPRGQRIALENASIAALGVADSLRGIGPIARELSVADRAHFADRLAESRRVLERTIRALRG
jgi:hypothetical protein